MGLMTHATSVPPGQLAQSPSLFWGHAVRDSRYVQLVPTPSYHVASPSRLQTEPVLSQFDHVRTQFFYICCAVETCLKAALTPSYYGLKRDDRKTMLSSLKVLKHLSRSTPFKAVHKVRRQFVTRCYYDHSVLTQFKPV
ncbi:hypothetical protein DPMN_183227 [Dreissena polymorpha]|uniref:Uncharacterized protein n=1 Tax=Dreissena polymorpha TaxID=45954 RepID=A0A9D4DI10_DREPO|nr:hypothetical protein DPMN_183227 [Dreissena polymorpha]